MLAKLCLPVREVAWATSCALLLSFVASVHGDPIPLTKEEQAKVDRAIDKGVRYLKSVQRPSGWFPPELAGISSTYFPYVVGQSALPALALLECGVPADDPSMQKVAALMRKRAMKLDTTYELPLVILFLDRLGQREDEELIRSLALRLIAGQTYSGGWSYRCPLLTVEQEKALLKGLGGLQERSGKPKQAAHEGGRQTDATAEPPAELAKLAVFQKPEALFPRREASSLDKRVPFLPNGGSDNSNTQFATLGLWAAQRHGLPLQRSFRLLARRFERSQSEDGSWSYRFQLGGVVRKILPATNTGAGLLGLAVGSAELQAEKEEQGRRKQQIIRGLAYLNNVIADPTQRFAGREFGEPNYYLFWTVERVATLYNLRAIGEQDWYRWGAAILLANQRRGGEWPLVRTDVDRSYAGNISTNLNTALALLFLKKANPCKDLSAKLPLKAEELNKGILALREPTPPREDASPGKVRR